MVPRLAALAHQNDAYMFGHLLPSQRALLRTMLEGLVQHHQMHDTPLA